MKRAMRHGWVVMLVLGLAAPAFARPKQRKVEAGVQLNAATPPGEASESEGSPPPAADVAEDAAPVSVTPAAVTDELPPPPTADAAGTEQLSGLQTELSTLMDELVQARTRAALIGKTLWKTQVRVYVQNLAGDDAILAKIVLKLDGAPIFRGD